MRFCAVRDTFTRDEDLFGILLNYNGYMILCGYR